MTHYTTELAIETPGTGLTEVTRPIAAWVAEADVRTGLLTVYIRHTSASLIIQENADPAVQDDMIDFFRMLVPEDEARYRHTAEGPDDMPAHIRAALTQTSIGIPVIDGRLALGTWQGIFVFEHRIRPQRRRLALHLMGED